ncbi:MAG: 30S ribosomal protein S1 [Firmicutes bacterium HGW-Firmicutes-1]|jgi:small subunit ribosomal protein S1|nr:MAG: 30S ribosomal protein S1 [Firmicutes bacterium HGW-Firmicutes-1]
MNENESNENTMNENPNEQIEKNEIELIENSEKEIEDIEVIPSMDEFENELYKGFKKLYLGDIVEGTIITVTDSELLVNIGYISDGIIPVAETMATEEQVITEMYQEGDPVKAEIIKTDDGEGNILLSIKKAEEILIWGELEKAFISGDKMNVKVKEVVKGGVVCNVKGARAFIPASQLSIKYVEDLNSFIGEELIVKVIDFDKDKKKVVLSRKEVELKENEIQKSLMMDTIKKGDKFMGTVVKVVNFGAFVDIGGVQGLVHIQDLSWKKVKHPSEIVKEGDVVEVYIIDIDTKTGKVGLGLKDVKEDPWEHSMIEYTVGKIVTGEVERIATYGAFVKIGDGIDGLVHISEMSDKRISKPQEVVAVGDKVQVKIINIDKEAKRIQLSMKSVEGEQYQEDLEKYQQKEEATTSLEDIFKVFLKDIH